MSQISRFKRWISIISLVSCFYSNALLHGQGNYTEVLYPYVRNFNPREYGDLAQNWSITQDKRGIIYVANNGGVLEYDGVSWRTIPTKDVTLVKSVVVAPNGCVYVGATDEIGYLAPNKQGKMEFISLNDKIPEGERSFESVWAVFANEKEVYFHTSTKIFHYNLKNQTIKIWKAEQEENDYHFAFLVNGHFYVRQRGIGLLQQVGDSLQLVKKGDLFAEERIYVMQPYLQDQILVGTRTKGFFLFNGNEFKPFLTEADSYINEYTLYNGIQLPNGNYALATLSGGVIIINSEGKIIQYANTSNGLQDDCVNAAFVDNQNGLWLALSNGISRVEALAPLSYRIDPSGQKTYAQQMIRHEGTLYIATASNGVFYKKNSTQLNPTLPNHFLTIPALANYQCWWFLAFDKQLLVATSEGLYRIYESSAELIRAEVEVLALERSKKNPNRIYLGLANGLEVLYYQNGQWISEGKIEEITDKIRKIEEAPDGKLWLGTTHKGLICVDMSTGFNLKPKITRYNEKDGLLSIYDNYPFETQTQGLLFGNSDGGVFRFDEKQKRFMPDTLLSKPKLGAFQIIEDSTQRLWVMRYIEAGNYFKIDGFASLKGTYRSMVSPFDRAEKSVFTHLYPENDGVIWLSSSDGIVRLDTKTAKNYSQKFPVYIRRVIINDDSTLFYGAFADESGFVTTQQNITPVLHYKLNAFRFECAALNFDASERNQYRYYLEGLDANWSAWVMEAKKDYTNLPAGFYRFHVKAKNVYGVESRETVFEFEILPPWYKTWWAMSIWGLSLVGGVIGVVQWRLRQLKAENILLEQKVAERTAEVVAQKAQLEVAYTEIQVQNDNLQVANEEIQKQQAEIQKAYEEIQKQNDNLQEAYQQIEHKNNDIMDSIKYARRIQESILPNKEFIQQYLPNSFVLYKPRDIVSGDFYWFSVKNGIAIIAAIDCTGHGVPGAFMSVMANSLLNQIVNERGITVADDILNTLNYNVKVTLHQMDPNSTSNDGMDIALCTMNFEEGTFSFAGANRPLFYFKNGELEEVKGTKFPIGGRLYQEEQVFHKNDFQIVSGDTIYICSDGYVDQFGGPKRKKFMTGKFKELLTQIQTISLEDQCNELDRVIEDWKGDVAQLDDILVIGVRF